MKVFFSANRTHNIYRIKSNCELKPLKARQKNAEMQVCWHYACWYKSRYFLWRYKVVLKTVTVRSPVGGKLLSYPIGNILTSLYKLGTTGEDFNADLAHQLEDEANNTLALSPFELSVTKRIRYDKAHRRRTCACSCQSTTVVLCNSTDGRWCFI